MARLLQTGFELNDLTGKEGFTVSGANPPTISTNRPRTGTYSLRQQGGTGSSCDIQFVSANGNGPFYFRTYVNVASYPSDANGAVFFVSDSANTTVNESVAMTSTGALQLKNGIGTQFGSNSSVLSLNTWYRVELYCFNNTTSGTMEDFLYLNGTLVASTKANTEVGGMATIHVGNGGGSAAVDMYFDDIAVNDSTGSFQNLLPGPGSITYMRPDAAGDVNTFATQTGGTAGSANNFTRVNEIPPDDATTFNGSNTLNQEDLFNCGPSKIGGFDIVNAVQVGARFRNSVADATTAITFEIEKVGSGTKALSSAIIPNTTTFNTNATALPRNSVITLYNDPNGSAWTQSTLDSLQVGYKLTTGGTNRIDVTGIWVTADTVPPTQVTAIGSRYQQPNITYNVGMF